MMPVSQCRGLQTHRVELLGRSWTTLVRPTKSRTSFRNAQPAPLLPSTSPTRMLTLPRCMHCAYAIVLNLPNAVRNDPRSPKRATALAKVLSNAAYCRARSSGSPVRPGPGLDALDEEHGSLLDPAGLCEGYRRRAAPGPPCHA